MGLIGDSITLYQREMLIFRANIRTNLVRASLFPIVIILLFGNLGASVSNVPVVIVNYANNPQSLQFISNLQIQSAVSVQGVTDQATAMSQLSTGQASFVIVILPNFPSHNGVTDIQVYYSPSQFSSVGTVLPLVQQTAALVGAQGSVASSQYQPSQSSSTVLTTPINGASGSYKDFLFSGLIGMVVVFSALFGGGMAVITDRQAGAIKSFLVTPVNKSAIMLGRILAGAVQSIIYIVVVLIIGLLDGSSIAMGLVGIAWIFVLGIILSVCFTAVALILSSRIKNVQVYAIFSQAIGLPLWLLSGGIFPVSSLPSALQAASVVNPMTYAVQGFRYVVLQGVYPIGSIITDLTILIGFSIIVTVICIKLFKSTID